MLVKISYVYQDFYFKNLFRNIRKNKEKSPISLKF